MTLTPEEWETELESVDQVAARDTEPAPPPTEPNHAPPTPIPAPLDGDFCEFCGGLFEHAEGCVNFGVFR